LKSGSPNILELSGAPPGLYRDCFTFTCTTTFPFKRGFTRESKTLWIVLHLLGYFCSADTWRSFVVVGEVLLLGFLFHYVPYFFVERTLFLHHYLPAFTFKVLLMAAVIEHLHRLFW